ncbi:hypothetical protein T459_00603 [Capsicum annuum]|uniref:DUF4408 domain-containing protein n=1 Tax=Capsicum annuum TaxID=4072 RepID=A0A2G3AEQ9_CAPAN|nr:hypothetical protein T459_00603 [Capsicum annuum]
MESLNIHNIKVEKANAKLRYKKRQRVTTLFRFIEFCIFFVIISRFSTQLPLGIKLSTDYFKGVGVTLISPRFVFVLGNVIVIILFLKSGQSSDTTNNVKIDLYDEYKQKCSTNKEVCCEQIEKQSILVEKAYFEQIKKQRKQSIHVEKAYCEQSKKQRKQSTHVERQVTKKIPRSHSDNSLYLSSDEKKHPRKSLMRSATVRYTENVKPTTTMTTTSYPEDEMSNEEFRKTVENFIARQQRFLREEEFEAVVSYKS